MAAVITADNSDIGPGNVQGPQREGEKEKASLLKVLERAKVKAGWRQTNLVTVREKVLMEKVRGKVGGIKVHVSTVAKLDIKQPSVQTHGLPRFLKLQKRLLGVCR